MNQSWLISATLEAVSQFGSTLDTHLSSLDIETRTGITLAMQELLVNIVRHAYAGTAGSIRIEMKVFGADIEISVEDTAPNPYIAQPIQAPDPLELPEHGMGMYIIHASFDDVLYERFEVGNRWHLRKRIGEVS